TIIGLKLIGFENLYILLLYMYRFLLFQDFWEDSFCCFLDFVYNFNMIFFLKKIKFIFKFKLIISLNLNFKNFFSKKKLKCLN
ncbi:hypothetical protein DFH28DRAFT_961300, partial [Melampsora americana]